MASATEERKLAFTPVYELAAMIKAKQLSPVELMEVVLKRIKRLNPELNAYLTIIEEQAMEGARQAEQDVAAKKKLGPLHGIPFSIKDLVNTKGIRTTFGSLIYKDNVPQAEGTMVQRFKAAGGILIGKTNTPEFGMACQTSNRLGDHCRNPWNPERTSGGSSGGAAAGAAAGISPIAQGSDGGGSVRIPASFCGLYGLKPNYGRVPKDVAPWGVSSVSCTGPLTRTVKDCALIMNVISGADGKDYTCIRTPPPDYVKALDKPVKKLKIAWSPDLDYGQYGVKVDAEVARAVEKAVKVFADMGHSLEETAPDIGEPFTMWDDLQASQAYIPYGFILEKHADIMTEYMRKALEHAQKLTGVEVAKAYVWLWKIRAVMLDFFSKYDLLLSPTTSVPAFPAGQQDRKFGRGFIDWAYTPFTAIFNLSMNPAAAVPCGFTKNGLPISLQIVGRLEDEVTVLQASAAYEQAQPWADKLPPVS